MADPKTQRIRISEARIQDYRAFKDSCITLEDCTVLIGANNTGKTSLLLAVGVGLGHYRGTADDCHIDADNRTAAEFQIDLRFTPWGGTEFDADTRAVVAEAVRPPEEDGAAEYFALRATGRVDARTGDFGVKRLFLKGWARDRDAASAIEELRTPAVSRDFNELMFFSLLGAQRDIVDDVGRKATYWGRLAADLGLEDASREELQRALEDVSGRIVAASPVLGNVQSHLQAISGTMGSAVESVEIRPVATRPEELVRGMDIRVAPPRGASVPVDRQGMGTRSLASILVYRAFLRERMEKGTGVPLAIAGFEEPEAHLHPHAQRSVMDLISEIPGQRVLSTHSAYVARVADIFDLRVFARRDGEVVVTQIPRRDDKGDPTFTEEALIQIRRNVQEENGELLFARCAVLLEGVSEQAALPVFARAHWSEGPDAIGVSLVSCNGAGSAKHLAKFLEAIGVPWIVLLDGDAEGDRSLAAISSAVGRELTAGSPEVVMFPKDIDFEDHLLAEVDHDTIKKGLESLLGEGTLDDYRTNLHGQKKRGGVERDYQSAGWEARLLADCLDNNKGLYGRPVAEAIVETLEEHGLPSKITELLQRVDAILAAAPETTT